MSVYWFVSRWTGDSYIEDGDTHGGGVQQVRLIRADAEAANAHETLGLVQNLLGQLGLASASSKLKYHVIKTRTLNTANVPHTNGMSLANLLAELVFAQLRVALNLHFIALRNSKKNFRKRIRKGTENVTNVVSFVAQHVHSLLVDILEQKNVYVALLQHRRAWRSRFMLLR